MPNIIDIAAHQELDTLATYVTINDKRIASLFRWSSCRGTGLDFFFNILCLLVLVFPPPYLAIFFSASPPLFTIIFVTVTCRVCLQGKV